MDATGGWVVTERIRLLEADPELGAALPPRTRALVDDRLIVRAQELDRGPWSPPDGSPRHMGLLVVDGLMLREVVVSHGHGVELLGRGDLLRPWQEDPASFCEALWTVLEPSRIAILDAEASKLIFRCPPVASVIIDRAVARSRSLALQAAIMNVAGVEERLHALLWALAEKWGSVEEDGVVLEVKLAQRILGELVGSRRPTVSAALGSLTRRGLIGKTEEGYLLLYGEPPALPATDSQRTRQASSVDPT